VFVDLGATAPTDGDVDGGDMEDLEWSELC